MRTTKKGIMKKLIVSLVLLVLGFTGLSAASAPIQEKPIQIHTEKRPFIRKGDPRRHGRHHHHHPRRKGGGRHMRENHKK